MGLSGETPEGQPRLVKCRTLAKPVQPKLSEKPRRAKHLLAQCVGPCFTLCGHMAGGVTQMAADSSKSATVQLL